MMDIIGASATLNPDLNNMLGDWVSMRIFGEPGQFEKYCTVGVFDDGKIIGGVVMHEWQPHYGTIELSAAGEGRWQSRRLIREVFGACFDVLGCQLIVMRNNESNKKTISNSRRLGFEGVYIPRLAGRDEGQWIFTLTDDAWREHRLNKRSGQNG